MTSLLKSIQLSASPAYLSTWSRQFSLLTKTSLIYDSKLPTPVNASQSVSLVTNSLTTTKDLLTNLTHKRLMYTFRLSNKIVRNTHATRPKKTNNNSVELTYEQAQFAEKIGLTKSWNSWNTCKSSFF